MALPAIIAGAMRSAALAEYGGGFGASAGGGFASGQNWAHPTGARPGWGLLQQNQMYMLRINVVSQQLAESTKSLWERFKELNKTIAYVNYNVHAFSQLIHGIPDRFVKTFTFAVDAMATAARPFVNLAARNNPAVVKQFELAQNDAYGVLGRMMIPVVQAFTRQMRSLGDTMAGLEPVMRPAIAAVAQFVDVSGKQLTDAIKANAALFDTLGVALAFVAHEATSTIRVVGTMAKLFGFINGFNTGSKFDPNATSMGAGIRTSRQIGQPEELQNELIKNALIAGAGPGGTKEERQTNYLMNIDRTLGFIWGVIQKVAFPISVDKDIRQSKILGRLGINNDVADIYSMLRTS